AGPARVAPSCRPGPGWAGRRRRTSPGGTSRHGGTTGPAAPARPPAPAPPDLDFCPEWTVVWSAAVLPTSPTLSPSYHHSSPAGDQARGLVAHRWPGSVEVSGAVAEDGARRRLTTPHGALHRGWPTG